MNHLKQLFKTANNVLEGGAREETSVPESLVECDHCKNMLRSSNFALNAGVCPKCGFHHRISARERIGYLCDLFSELFCKVESQDPLHFPGYREKLSAAREKSGEKESVVTGVGVILKVRTCLFVLEPNFMMGSMGTATGEKLTRLFEYATEKKLPVVGFSASGGARMQEGMFSLMQMAKVSAAVKRHSDAGLFYLSILTNPTTGGVSASFAMLGDIILAEPGALIGFAGPRVIEQTIKQKLPEGFQTAEYVLKGGFLDAIAPRQTHRTLIKRLLLLHGCKEES